MGSGLPGPAGPLRPGLATALPRLALGRAPLGSQEGMTTEPLRKKGLKEDNDLIIRSCEGVIPLKSEKNLLFSLPETYETL